jgi:hypothetical protein
MNTRSTVEGFYFKAGVIGKAVDAVVFPNVFGLLGGVALNGIGGFGKFFVTPDFLEGLLKRSSHPE